MGVGLKSLSDHPELEYLGVMRLKSGQLQHLRELSHLKSLAILTPQSSDIGIESLSELNQIDSLLFDNCQFTGPILAKCPTLPSVTTLTLQESRLTSDELAYLQCFPHLKSLDLLKSVDNIQDEHLQILSQLENIEFLALRSPFGTISDVGLAHLARMKSLKTIVLLRMFCSVELCERVRMAVPHCKLIY